MTRKEKTLMKRGRKQGQQDWCWVRLKDFLEAGFAQDFAIRVNRKWLNQVGLLVKTESLEAKVLTPIKTVEKIQIKVHEKVN